MTRFSTLDGYTFTVMPDGSVTDGDLEWATVAEALHDLAGLLAPDQLSMLRACAAAGGRAQDAGGDAG